MFWVIQNNIYREQKHSVLMETLREKNIPHVEVKVVPFYDMLLPNEFDSNVFKGNINELPEIEIPNDQPVMALGATSLMRIAKEKGWEPGSFLNENFHYENWKKAYGEHLLNFEAIVDSFENINPPWEMFFIRPCEDTKDFNGIVFSKEEFLKWQKEELQGVECLFRTSDVVASPLKEIHAEYRFFVVDGKIVTHSQYKKGNSLYKDINVPKGVFDFANQMIQLWQPAQAFVIDIADTTEGLKVIEINNFNSAGFYHSDVVKIIEAIENMKLK